jgi:hypothetical protein
MPLTACTRATTSWPRWWHAAAGSCDHMAAGSIGGWIGEQRRAGIGTTPAHPFGPRSVDRSAPDLLVYRNSGDDVQWMPTVGEHMVSRRL